MSCLTCLTSAQPTARPPSPWGPRSCLTCLTFSITRTRIEQTMPTHSHIHKQVRQVSQVRHDLGAQRLKLPNPQRGRSGRLGGGPVSPGPFNIHHNILTSRSGSVGSSLKTGIAGVTARKMSLGSALWVWFGAVRNRAIRFGGVA